MEGFELISQISDIELNELLQKAENCRKEDSSPDDIEVSIEKLNPNQKKLLAKTIFYLLQRFNLFIIKPTKIQEDLKNANVPESKIELLLKYYRDQNKDMVDSLEKRFDGVNEITWKLKTVLSTETQKKVVPPMAIVDLELHSKDQHLNLELNHENLLELYESFENIQHELDLWSKS